MKALMNEQKMLMKLMIYWNLILVLNLAPGSSYGFRLNPSHFTVARYGGGSAKFSGGKPSPVSSSKNTVMIQPGSSSSNGDSANNATVYNYQTLFYEQILDHFSFTPSSYAKFRHRYLLSTKFWGGAQSMAPIFVYCGNEGNIEWFAQNTGFLWEIAPRYKAMVVFPEHRYYGQSIPDIAANVHTAETLGYLTSEQALADYVELITDLKRNFSAEHSPVVLFGGSYGGMLAAWMRLKYPHVAIGALASSAPILQFDHLVPIDGFMRILSEDYKNVSTSCYETIKASWNAIDAVYSEDDGNEDGSNKAMEKIKKLFKFCNNVSADADSVQDFIYTAWVYMGMTDYPYAANFLEPMPANPVKTACDAMDAFPDGTDILSKVVAGVNVYYNGTGEVQCFNIGTDNHGLGLWNWQACTEMIMPMSSNAHNSMFPPYNYSLSDTIDSCQSTYGVRPRPNWMVREFGGQDIHNVLKRFGSNIIFSNGLKDPWSNGGILQDISKSVVATVTAKGAHHLDLRASTKDDPEWLKEQRNFELKHISRWLNEYYADHHYNQKHP